MQRPVLQHYVLVEYHMLPTSQPDQAKGEKVSDVACNTYPIESRDCPFEDRTVTYGRQIVLHSIVKCRSELHGAKRSVKS